MAPAARLAARSSGHATAPPLLSGRAVVVVARLPAVLARRLRRCRRGEIGSAGRGIWLRPGPGLAPPSLLLLILSLTSDMLLLSAPAAGPTAGAHM